MAAMILVIMGVSGSGKTTIGEKLAARLGWQFADGDDFHPPHNVQKMRSGQPLTDDDRWPWLRAIADWIDARRETGENAIVACSALKRSYRDLLLGGRPGVHLVYLKGDIELIRQRMTQRRGHFMPTALLQSQFDALEEPTSEERGVTVSIDATRDEVVTQILAALGLQAAD